MSHDPSRKHFLAKLLGLTAAVGLAPKLLAKTASAPVAPPPPSAPVCVQPDSRAVARHGHAA